MNIVTGLGLFLKDPHNKFCSILVKVFGNCFFFENCATFILICGHTDVQLVCYYHLIKWHRCLS